MENPIVRRIVKEAGVSDLIDILAQRLDPSDLQSLLLAVYKERAESISPSALLNHYRRNLSVGWRFWLRWVVANGFGFGIGFPLGWGILLRNESSPGIWVTVLTSILAWALVSAVMGLLQWMVLRPVFADARWILATIIGWTVGVITSAAVAAGGMPAFALVYGTAIGLSQANVLRWSLCRTALWTVVTAASWAIGWALLTPLQPGLTALGSDVSPFALGMIVGAVSGAITGFALVWLLGPNGQADI